MFAHIFDYIPASQHNDILAGTSFYDSTPDFVAAFLQNSKVYAPAGKYEITHIDLNTGNKLEGDGIQTIIHQISGTNSRPGAYDGMFTLNYNNNSTPTRDVSLRNLQFMMDLPTGEYTFADECSHIILAGHTEHTVIEDVWFKGWRGDAIFVGGQMSGVGVPTDYVAESTYINRCEFDGINSSCRQAITGGSVDGLYVNNVKIKNVTNPNMPGAICIEPELPTAYARNIHLSNMRIFAVGVHGARRRAVVVDLGNLNTTDAFKRANITVSNSQFGDTSGFDFFGKRMRNVTVRDIDIYGVGNASSAQSIDKLTLDNINFKESGTMLVGMPGAEVRELMVNGVVYRKCDGTAGALQLHAVCNGTVSNSNFIDCGGADGAIVLSTGGSTTGLNVSHNLFESPSSLTPYGAHVHTGHTKDPASKFEDNVVRGAIMPQMGW